MSMDFLVSIDLNKNELQNAVLHPLATAPPNPAEGQIYYNSADDTVYVYDGSAWKAVGAVQSVAGKTGVVTLVKGDVGLGNVDNTSDAAKKTAFTGTIADGDTGFVTGDAAYDALALKLNLSGGTMSGAIAMGGNKVTGLADGTNDQDAVTKKQLDAAKLGTLKPSGSVTFANLPQLSASVLNNIYNVTDAFTTTSDFVEGSGKSYPAGTNVAIINTGTDANPVYKYDAYTGVIDLSPYLVRTGDTMSGNLAMGGNKVTGLGTPTADSDAATKKYVDDTAGAVVKTATGTIGTSATSAEVSYSGTLINAYATQGGSIVICDIAVTASKVTFSVAAAPSSAITCTVVYT